VEPSPQPYPREGETVLQYCTTSCTVQDRTSYRTPHDGRTSRSVLPICPSRLSHHLHVVPSALATASLVPCPPLSLPLPLAGRVATNTTPRGIYKRPPTVARPGLRTPIHPLCSLPLQSRTLLPLTSQSTPTFVPSRAPPHTTTTVVPTSPLNMKFATLAVVAACALTASAN
jgi:hypothetical protein